jgi:hypothetical protein
MLYGNYYNSYHKNCIHNDRASDSTAIFVHKSYPSIPIPINSNLEVTAIKITFKNIILSAIYISLIAVVSINMIYNVNNKPITHSVNFVGRYKCT